MTHSSKPSCLKKGPCARSFIVLSLLAALLLFWSCQDASKPRTAEVSRPVITDVKTVPVVPSPVPDTYETTGTVRADHVSTVAARIMGTVDRLYVREGDRVREGQLLLTIESQDLKQRVRQAAMALESAKQNKALVEKTWQRYRMLYDQKALSPQEMDQVDTQKNVAESEVERARAHVEEAGIYEEFSRIKAPIAGMVASRPIMEGSMAAPGQPLLTIEGMASLYVEGFVDESLAGRLRKGMAATVVMDAEGRLIPGVIRDMVPSVDPRSRTFLVKIGIAAGGLRSGAYARILIPLGSKEALLVPGGAIVTKGQLTGVYTVASSGVVTYRLVKAGRVYPDGRTEILSGLSPNEQIITDGVRRAVDGGMIQKVPGR